MSVTVKGVNELRSRLTAIKPNPGLMRSFALAAVREQKLLVPRRTGNLGRSIRVGAVSPTFAETVATADYAAYVELGTRPHVIVPKRAKVLAFPADRASATLSGRIRAGGRPVFAKRVNHPGTRAKPYMVPGAKKALDDLGVEAIVEAWDGAA